MGIINELDPLKLILKKIIITGNIKKCKNKKAIVKYMFFNKEDIEYFKNIELFTLKGLKGKIRQSLGTHGLIKC